MGTNAVPTPATGHALEWGPDHVVSATGRASVTQGSSFRDKLGNTFSTKLNYSLKKGDWTVNAGGAYTESRSWYRALDRGHFSNVGTTLQGVSTVSAWNITGDPGDVIIWKARNAAGADIDERNLNNYRIGTLRDDPLDGSAVMKEAKLDVEKQFDLSIPFSLKAGADMRDETRDNRRYQNDYGPSVRMASRTRPTTPPARSSTPSTTASTRIGAMRPFRGSTRTCWPSSSRRTPRTSASAPAPIRRVCRRRASASKTPKGSRSALPPPTSRRRPSCSTTSLTSSPAVRFEKTNDKGEGMLSNPDAVWQTNADGSYVDGNPSTPGVQRVRKPEAGTVGSMEELHLVRIERGAKADRSYDGYYPGVHLTYNITDDLLARFSYAKTIGRPDYANIIPATDINFDDSDPTTGFITIRNTALQPWTADNFDFSLEYYFKKA